MDTSKLVVGQEMRLKSGPHYGMKGIVVKIEKRWLRKYIEVEVPEEGRIRFDRNGKACDSHDIYHGLMWGRNDDIPGTRECGPWELYEDYPLECTDPDCTLPKDFKRKHV
jgi:hypothetical protein